jgi:hypothetical protein
MGATNISETVLLGSRTRTCPYACAKQFQLGFRDSGSSVVAMVQAAESRLRNHSAPIDRANSASRSLLAQPEVSAVLVVVADVVGQDSPEMALVERNDVVQQITPAALYPSLRSSVLPGTLAGCPHGSHSH